MSGPRLRFLSLFVADLDAARVRYQAMLGVAPLEGESEGRGGPPAPHPFAARGPCVFDLGGVLLALYQHAPTRGTHEGDVGIGLVVDEPIVDLLRRAKEVGAITLPTPPGGAELAVIVLPDRHFFEVTAT
jgi:hypothetical protein